jgi:microcystin degradation protein MlrC
MRVVIGGINHETSTFTLVPTTWDSYYERFYLHGADIIETFRGTNTVIGGFIDGAKTHHFELIPTVFAEPHPSLPTPRSIFDTILGELLAGIKNAGNIDGILLDLHGSMVVDNPDTPAGIADPEGHILTAIRNLVGPSIPIVAQLDIHANVSQQMVVMADVLVGRETYPEIDMAEKGHECADILVRMVKDGLRPTMAIHQMPMVWGLHQVTNAKPMREAIAYLHEIEARTGVVCGSIAVCYFLADVPDMGSSVYVVTDNNQALAQQLADELGAWCFARRADWHYELPSTAEAIQQARVDNKFPIILADTHDNTGGGSPGDSTGMLQAFVDATLEDACVLYMVDKVAVAVCENAGIGATIKLDIGGKSSPLQGKPVTMTVEVMALSDGIFKYGGAMYAGLSGNMGASAYVRQGGIHIILVSVGEQPYDTAFAESLGLNPRKMRYVGVKSTAHFRAGFESWAGSVQLVNEPSLHNWNNLSFKRLGRKVYPFDDI